MSLKSYCLVLGSLIVLMIGVHCSTALKVYPSFQPYDDNVEFSSFICTDDNDDYISGDDVEWLSPNFTLLMSSPDDRISVYGDFVTFSPPLFSDAGSYWCRNRTNHSDIAEGRLIFKDAPTAYEERVELRGNDIIINCSVGILTEQNDTIAWARLYPNILISETLKYTVNTAELIIHNVSSEDEGEYLCYSEELAITYAVVDIIVIWSLELIFDQNQTVTVIVGEELILNCTVSAVPDPVYSWSFPDSCSSCPNTRNDSVLIFTAEDITDSGEYTCVAENKYGNISMTFDVTGTIPPTFVFSNDTKLFEKKFTFLGSDAFINCSVNYGTEYNITSWLFDNEPLLINQTTRFSQNTSGLIIYNVTELDEGNYTCCVDKLRAYILVHVEWPPTLLSKSDQTVRVNVSEEVMLNCTVSASPDPVYSWSFPDSCSSCPNTSNDSVLSFTADTTDSGEYIFTAENQHGNISITFNVFVKVWPTFKFTNQFKERNVLLESDVFLNCSVDYGTEPDNIAEWRLDGELLRINDTSKYDVNTSGLTVYTVTAEDQGNYSCYVYHLTAVTFLHVVWPPEFPTDHSNQRMTVNVSDEMILNCTVSASPDPVYNWSFPDSCSSCPYYQNSNVMFLNANVNDSGEYVCMAKNEYGNTVKEFGVNVNSKPIIIFKSVTIRKDHSTSNVMLTCPVQYTYPTAQITWGMMTESSRTYRVLEENSTGNYILLNNQSLEVYRRFIYEEDHVNVKCLASNKFGYAETVFNILDHEHFSQRKTFVLYVRTQNCEELSNRRSEELFQVLREWFKSVCNCDGLNNLYSPQVTCEDESDTVGKVTSTVHSDDSRVKTAEMLIDLAKNAIQSRDPAQANISSDWIICLSKEECDVTDAEGPGTLPNAAIQEFTVYVKNTRCRNNNANTELINAVKTWLRSVCSCDFQQCIVSCFDNTTANVTFVFQSNDNYTAQMLIDLMVQYMQRENHSVVYLQSGWAICLSTECEWKLDNTITVVNNSTGEPDFMPLIVGATVGVLSLCLVIIPLLCFIAIAKRINKNKESKMNKDSFIKTDDHIYDELDAYAKLNEKTITSVSVKMPSPKSDKVIFDTSGIEPPTYQSLAEPRYQSCGAISIARSNLSNNCHIDEDAKSIKDKDCQFTSEKTMEQHEENRKEQEPYSKLHHFK